MITTATEARGAKLRRYKLPITVICVHTVQYSVQYSTVHYSTVQYSTVLAAVVDLVHGPQQPNLVTSAVEPGP